jgi:hypothetical protein
MKTRKYLGIIGAVVLIIGVMYFLGACNSPEEQVINMETAGEVTPEQVEVNTPTQPALESGVELGTDGTVTAVDLSGIAADGPALITIETDASSVFVVAVPSMGLPLCAAKEAVADAGAIAVGDSVSVRGMTDAVGNIVPCESTLHFLKVHGVYQNSEVGLTFEYQKSPDGYQVETGGGKFSSDPSFVTGALLTDKKAAAELLSSVEPREFPPVITLRVYKNPEKLSPAEWVKAKPIETNFARALAEPVAITVGRADAVGFTTDGLYATDTYVVTYDDFVLVVTGEYSDPESAIFQDLEQVVASIIFARL